MVCLPQIATEHGRHRQLLHCDVALAARGQLCRLRADRGRVDAGVVGHTGHFDAAFVGQVILTSGSWARTGGRAGWPCPHGPSRMSDSSTLPIGGHRR